MTPRSHESQRERKLSKKLFVGGLAWATTQESLSQAFGQFGPVVEAQVIMDRETGRSRGFGFVTFENPSDADQAMRSMDGADLDGRKIRVNEAQSRERSGGPRGPGGGGGPGGHGRGGGREFGGGGGGFGRGERDFGRDDRDFGDRDRDRDRDRGRGRDRDRGSRRR